MAAVDRPTPRPRLSKVAADKPQAPPRHGVVPLSNDSPPSLPMLSPMDTASASCESTPTPSTPASSYSPLLAVENPEYMSLEEFRQICNNSIAAEPTLSPSILGQPRRPPLRPRPVTSKGKAKLLLSYKCISMHRSGYPKRVMPFFASSHAFISWLH